jgi:hypothetical protein
MASFSIRLKMFQTYTNKIEFVLDRVRQIRRRNQYKKLFIFYLLFNSSF